MDLNDIRVEAYKAYIEDVNQLRASRLGESSIRVTIVTLFLGAQAFIASFYFSNPNTLSLTSPDLNTWVPIVAIVAIGIVGVRFCNVWRKLVEDLTSSINDKFTKLRRMEESSQAMRDAGATLFMDEYKKRHPEYTPPPLPDTPASPEPAAPTTQLTAPASSADASKPIVPQRPVRGSGLRTIQLQDFFLWMFRIDSASAVAVKLLAISGAIQWLTRNMPAWLPRLPHV